MLDPVLEFNRFNDLRHSVCAVEFAPFTLRSHHQFERHGKASFAAEASFGFAGSVSDRGKGAFDWIGGADVLPVFGREVIESQEDVAVFV